jgi:hypothetical protein
MLSPSCIMARKANRGFCRTQKLHAEKKQAVNVTLNIYGQWPIPKEKMTGLLYTAAMFHSADVTVQRACGMTRAACALRISISEHRRQMPLRKRLPFRMSAMLSTRMQMALIISLDALEVCPASIRAQTWPLGLLARGLLAQHCDAFSTHSSNSWLPPSVHCTV